MVKTFQDMIRKTKRIVGEHESRGNTDDSDVAKYVNDAWEDFAALILTERDEFFSSYMDVVTDGSLYYDLPLGVERIYAIEDISGGSDSPIDTSPVMFENRFSYLLEYRGNVRYTIKRGKLILPDKNSGDTLRVFYPTSPRELFYGTVSAATSTSVTFGSAPTVGTLVPEDDYYNGMFLVTTDGQVREVTDYVGATGVFTVNAAWSTTPTGGTDVVSLTPPLYQYQSIIPLLAGIYWREELDYPVIDLMRSYEGKKLALLGMLRKTTTQEPIHVLHRER